MYYVYVEDSSIATILNYKAEVPNTVSITEISDEDYDCMHKQYPTKAFDVVTLKVVDVDNSEKEKIDATNTENLTFLASSDWMVMRHIRELALGVTTSLTEEEYLALEQQRADAAANIVR